MPNEGLVVLGIAIAITGWFVACTAWILLDESSEDNEERAASERRRVGE